MSRRPLPISFVVGIFSAIALGIAWGLVYLNMPSAPSPVATEVPSPSSQLPLTPLDRQTPVTSPLPPAIAPLTSDSSMNLPLPPVSVPTAPPPAASVAAPASASKGIKIPPVKSDGLAPNSLSASRLFALPAEETPALHNISPACIVELEKLCEGTEPGGARRTCFKDNESKLSPVCQRQMDDMAARIKEDMQHFRIACAGDVKQFCPDVHPGGGNVLQCLEENYKEVSEPCYQALKHFQTRKAGRSL